MKIRPESMMAVIRTLAAALVCGCQRVDGRGGKALPSAGITTRRPAVGVGHRLAVRRVDLSRDPDPPCWRCPPRPGPDACAPFDAQGLDFYEGMGEQNVEEFGAVFVSEEAHSANLERDRDEILAAMTPSDLAHRVELREQLHAIEAQMPPPAPAAWAIKNSDDAAKTFVLKRGNPNLGGPEVTHARFNQILDEERS